MKKCWIARKMYCVSVTGPYYVCLKENMNLLNFVWFYVFTLLILVHKGRRGVLKD